jgi:hypothetical protein
MTLSKDEWIRLWESIKKIEYVLGGKTYITPAIYKEIEFIKEKIQQVIGPME